MRCRGLGELTTVGLNGYGAGVKPASPSIGAWLGVVGWHPRALSIEAKSTGVLSVARIDSVSKAAAATADRIRWLTLETVSDGASLSSARVADALLWTHERCHGGCAAIDDARRHAVPSKEEREAFRLKPTARSDAPMSDRPSSAKPYSAATAALSAVPLRPKTAHARVHLRPERARVDQSSLRLDLVH